MIAPADDSTAVRRKHLRRVVVLLVALLAILTISYWATRDSVITRAQRIKVGQSRDEVHRLMGEPLVSLSLFGATDDYYSDMTAVELFIRMSIQEYLGFQVLSDLDKFAITVQYDSNLHVTEIKLPVTTDSSSLDPSLAPP